MTPLPVAELRERLNRLERLIMRDGEAHQWEAGEYFHPLIEMLEWAIAQRVQIEQVFEHVANVAALPNPPDDSENLGYTGSQCNVCGFRRDRPFEDFAICPACGAQFNYDDNLAYREDWINRGCPWFGRRSRNGGKYWRDGHDEI